jgi:hypothetical protein
MVTMTNTISIQERCSNKALDAFGEIEYQIDEYISRPFGSDWRCMSYLNTLAYSPMVVKYMSGQLDTLITEVKNKEGCEQLDEAYNFFDKTDKKNFIKFLNKIETDIQTYLANNKTRRRTKLKTPTQQVKKLPYLEIDKELVSINPEEIIRARSLFTYNVKTRKIAEYNGHLSVKNTSIVGFSSSREKTLTDRKKLDRIVTGGNIIASGFLDELNTKEKEPSKIITKNTILLKVIK